MPTLLEEFQRSWLTSLIGIVLLGIGIWLLTWNEGRAMNLTHSLDETFNNAIPLNPYEPLRPELDDRVVHISGNLIINEPLTEPEYGISIQAVKLKRRVQMYQWIEERTPRDYGDSVAAQNSDNNDYYYVTEWRDKLVDSSGFYIRWGHENPKDIPLKTVTYIAPLVKVGQLTVGEEIKEKFIDYVEVTSDESPERKDVKLHMGIYYHCEDIWNPEVGDIRVQFYYAGSAGEPVTIVAKQKDGVLVPFTTSKGHNIGMLRHGHLSINQMFSAEHSDARWTTWKMRAAGIFLLYLASGCLARLLNIMFGHIPILMSIIPTDGTSFGNFTLSISVSLIVIATAWTFYRPMLAAGLVFAAISPFLYCTMGLFDVAQNSFFHR